MAGSAIQSCLDGHRAASQGPSCLKTETGKLQQDPATSLKVTIGPSDVDQEVHGSLVHCRYRKEKVISWVIEEVARLDNFCSVPLSLCMIRATTTFFWPLKSKTLSLGRVQCP
ncbi:MAG: hypothetical protein FJX25_17820 [Alphaproteobacteria bacterium]|nr:hypothetical protein [Alphaproteobacteria bacterium]